MTNINYERMYKELVKQIKLERSWLEDEMKKETRDNMIKFDKGMKTAYDSILSKVEDLESDL